eukprot:Selendium_serpulae@DN6167_c1_g2_i4.p1
MSRFFQTDSVCFRSPLPELFQRQLKVLDPICASFSSRFVGTPTGVATTEGLSSLSHHELLKAHVASNLAARNKFEIACLSNAVIALKSLILGYGVVDGYINTDLACEASLMEETFQQEKWGQVEGAHDVEVASIRQEVAAAALYAFLLRDGDAFN